MADAGFGTSPTVLPNMFGSPGRALEDYGNTLERQNQWNYQRDYRKQKDLEADQWRKLQLIQELTDLSKHKTGSDVADALGNHLMSGIFQKYTQGAATMSPVELQAGIQKEMGGILGGMDAAKNDLAEADKQLAVIKQTLPELNHAQLYEDIRKDIITRRLKPDVSDFRNPMEVPPTTFDLNNPETLANYVAGDKALKEYFANPKGVDETTVFMGSPYSHTEYKGKVNPWRKANFGQLSQGFLPKGAAEPSLGFRSTAIPLESAKDQPFEVIEDEVFKNSGLSGMEQLQLIKAAKSMPGYEKFNPEEKRLAQRKAFLDYAKANDKTDFYPSRRVNAPASVMNYFNPKSGSDAGVNVNDIYGRIEGKVKEFAGKGFGTRFTALDADEKSVIKSFVGNNDMPDEQIFLKEKPDGRIGIYRTSEDGKTVADDKTIVTTLPKLGTNFKVQSGVKPKNEVVAQGNDAPKTPTSNKMVTMIMPDGKQGIIPESKVAEFLKKYPNAKRK